MNRLLFHITSPQEWQKAQAEGMYRPESLEREGFITFPHVTTYPFYPEWC
jgi:uncharacterized protein (DUF952 family)